jgi:hypothetical protein
MDGELVKMELTKKAFVAAFEKSFGNITLSCKAVGISRQTFYNYSDSDPEFVRALTELEPREALKDFIESALFKKIREGDPACTIFAAKTIGKERGYVERTEHMIKTDEPIEVELRIDK